MHYFGCLTNVFHLSQISARTAIIDFTVTMKGLEDQLLGRVIQTEKHELEAERLQLMEEVTSNKRKMKELEDNLLFRLTSTKVEKGGKEGARNQTKETLNEICNRMY